MLRPNLAMASDFAILRLKEVFQGFKLVDHTVGQFFVFGHSVGHLRKMKLQGRFKFFVSYIYLLINRFIMPLYSLLHLCDILASFSMVYPK